MKGTPYVAITLALLVGSCGGSRASNCAEYAAEVRQHVEQAESAEELMDWLQDTSEHAAKLIQASPQQAQPCADAILEATFGAAAIELESFLNG
jgi:histidine ammonia-lyase